MTLRLITDREARALREDSLSSIGDCAIKRLRPQPARIYGPVRDTLRLWAMPGQRRQRCRACNALIEDRTPVIRFHFHGQHYDQWAYIHQECPEVVSGS